MGLFSQSHDVNKETSKQIIKFKHHLVKSDNVEKIYTEFLKIVNNFISRRYGLHYKFTYEDLKYEILEILPEEQKQIFSEFLDKLNELEFDRQKINKDILLSLSEKFSDIIDLPKVVMEKTEEKKIPIGSFSDDMFAPPSMKENNIEDNEKEEVEKLEVKKEDIIKTKEPEKIKVKNPDDEIKIEVPSEKKNIAEPPPKKEIFEELPSFEVKKLPIQTELENVIKNLNKNKKEISQEISLIKKEQDNLEKQSKSNSKKSLPPFKIFNKKKEDEIKELQQKREILMRREKLIDDKLVELHKIEEQLTEFSKNLKQDKSQVNKRKEYLESKEKIISKIKKDMKRNYEKALKEIEDMKKSLKEKEEQFLGLQEFLKKRENKLSIEEENLLNEKRRYNKSVSNLIEKHLFIAKQDLETTEKTLGEIKNKVSEADKQIKDYEKKYNDLEKKKDELKNYLKEKQEYFSNQEKEFRGRDDEFAELSNELDSREKEIARLEKELKDYEKTIEESEEEIRKRTLDMEVKEVDLKSIDRDVDRLKFDIDNHKVRLDIREKQFKKRNDSFERIRKDVKNNIANEKRAIKRLEKRLGYQERSVDNELEKIEETGKLYDQELKIAKDLPEFEERTEDIHLSEINITHEFPEREIGNPNYLDILRLLNKARVFIRTNQKQKSRDVYLEIQRIFEDLNEEDKEELYPQVMEIYKTRPGVMTNMNTGYSKNIDILIQNFENSVMQGNLQESNTIYSELQQRYQILPNDKKPKYFNKIMSIYNRISTV